MALTVIDSLNVDNPSGQTRQVLFCQGDLTDMSASDAVTVLVVSALPGDYTPSAGSLIGALAAKNVSVAALSQDKAANYEPTMPCWVSQPIQNPQPGIQFQRILLYEPGNPATNSAALAWTIYQATKCFSPSTPVTIAMPIVSTGSGGADPVSIMRALFYRAVHWCSFGPFPLGTVKIVAYTQAQVAQLTPVFAVLKGNYQNVFGLSLPNSYAAYVSQATNTIDGRTIPPTVTRRQAVAVAIYTSQYYGQINSTLRNVSPSDPAYLAMMPLFEAIDSGLTSIAPYAGTTYRGDNMTPERRNQYQVGATILSLAYTSSSFVQGGWGTDQLTIAGQTGDPVSTYSIYPAEQEVLFGRNMTVLVTQRNCPNPNQGCTFWVSEQGTNWCGGS